MHHFFKFSHKILFPCILSFAILSGCSPHKNVQASANLEVDNDRAISKALPYTPIDISKSLKAPRFEDAKPHEWGRLTPWHYPIHGVDVSKYQGSIDWGAVRDSGISFAFIKATEGGDRVDDNFKQNWIGTSQIGLPRGAYHFYYWCRSGAEQARWFIRNVPKDRNALPPVLDLEWNDKSPTCRIRPPKEEVQKQVRSFLKIIKAHYGKTPIIYTTIDFFDNTELHNVKGYTFWFRSVAGHPEEKYGPHPWTFWQYTGTGRVPGINGNADINVFYGNPTEWQNYSL